MGSMDLEELRKQASTFWKEKVKAARLVLTDTTEWQLMTEEATNGDEWGPETKVMATIAEAAKRVEECSRILLVIRQRLALVGLRHWRQLYKTLVLVEYLLTHGPERIAVEFGSDRDVLEELRRFNCIDERGFDRGLSVRQKAKRVLELLNDTAVLEEERNRARKISHEILGFGGFSSGNQPTSVSSFSVEGFGNSAGRAQCFDEFEFNFSKDTGKVTNSNTNIHPTARISSNGSPSEWHPFKQEDIRQEFSKNRVTNTSGPHSSTQLDFHTQTSIARQNSSRTDLVPLSTSTRTESSGIQDLSSQHQIRNGSFLSSDSGTFGDMGRSSQFQMKADGRDGGPKSATSDWNAFEEERSKSMKGATGGKSSARVSSPLFDLIGNEAPVLSASSQQRPTNDSILKKRGDYSSAKLGVLPPPPQPQYKVVAVSRSVPTVNLLDI